MYPAKSNLWNPRLRLWRLVAICTVCLFAALSVTFAADAMGSNQAAQSRPILDTKREFWVWDLRVMPPAFRRASATLRATGNRSLIYVEDSLWGGQLGQDFVHRLQWQLETAVPSGAWNLDSGVIPLEEKLFGGLPRKAQPDERLVVLFADLGQYKEQSFDGFFNPFDQLTDAEAQRKYKQRSNEANIIYVNGFRRTEAYTAGVIAHELQHLLASAHSESEREVWLSETLAEAAMLLTGYFTDQPHVNALAKDSGRHPLVTLSYVSYGPQLLFSSFLLDSLAPDGPAAISAISRAREPGKAAVERIFREYTGAPLSFDAIFSSFVSYVFNQASTGSLLPYSWAHKEGVVIPKIAPYYTFLASSGELVGQLAPYSFLAIDLSREISPSVVIQAERIDAKGAPGAQSCAREASVLWKPISSTRIALYSVGCDPVINGERINFRLKILDQPFLPAFQFP